MDTLTQVERLIELAIIQRSELRRLVEELPQLKTHLSEEIERTFEETEPQLRAELEEWTTKQTADKTAALGVALEAKIADLAKSLEVSTQARYNAIIAERAENARLAAQAEAKIAEHAASLPGAVKEIVSAELARFPRAGEIDQLRKEFAEPKSLNPRGKWVAGETYNKLDLVTINGDSYVSNIDGNTEKPSRSAGNWTLNAARGNSGGGGGITALNDLLGNPSAGDIVGSEGNNYVRKTLTAGTGITITDDPSTITIDASGAQEMLTATVKNAESVAITRGQVVYLFSATGGFPSVKLAYNTSDATSAKTFGVVSDVSIAPNGTGTITCVGVVSNLNLGAYNDGDTVYLGATPGSFTATKPYAPNHLVYVGIIERANAGNGELYVRVQNGYELDEIHDVQINNPRQAGQTLIYDATNALWKNARLTAGVGVSITNADSSITISADGGVNYQGTWNASTNTPTLTSSVGTKGFYYVVSVAGSTNLNGVTDWKVGDWAIFNGTAWEKVDTTDQVSSVFGRTGAVVGVSTDYSSVGITNTAIGASNPSTGAFTTLSATGNLTVSGTGKVGGGSNDVIKLEADTAGNGGYVQGRNAADTDYTPLILIGNGLTLKRRSGVNSSANALAIDTSGNTTLSGNLTVSGTGTSSVAGKLAINGGDLSASQFAIAAPSGSLAATLTAGATTNQSFGLRIFAGTSASDYALKIRNVGDTSTLLNVDGVGATTIGGNLTVSGTGNSTFAGNVVSKNTAILFGDGADNSASLYATGGPVKFWANATEAARIFSNGNLFIGASPVDGGQKLQVSGSAIFGSTNTAQLSNPTGQIIRQQFSASTVGLRLEADSANGHAVIGTTSNHSLLLRSNDTTALTLDSSQNATFSKDIFLGTSGPSVKSTLSARAPRQGLVFDGTRGAEISGPTLGAGDWTFSGWVYCKALGGSILGGANNSLRVSLRTNGAVFYGLQGGANSADTSTALPVDKWSHLVITKTGTSGTVYLNGISIQTSTDGRNYSVAQGFIGSTSNATGDLFNGVIVPSIYNRALSASEVVALYEAGAPAGADYPATVAGTDVVTNGNFSSATGWNVGSGWAISGGIATTNGTADGGGGTELAQTGKSFKAGQRIRVTFTLGNVSAGGFRIVFYGGSANTLTTTRTASGTYTEEVVLAGSATAYQTIARISGTSLNNGATLDDLSIVPLGLLLAPDAAQAGGGLVWYDTSGNAANITLPASGVSWNVPTSGNVTSGTALNLRAGGSNQDITLTPSGTGGHVNISSSGSPVLDFTRAGTLKWEAYSDGSDNFVIRDAVGAANRLTIATSTGNFLIGGSTDSGNGRLQLATHTTSAGGIGFGTDTSLYRTAAGDVSLDGPGGSDAILRFKKGGVEALRVESNVGSGYITASGTLYVRSGGSTALTLDSSQNATFAGAITSSRPYQDITSGLSNIYVYSTDTAAQDKGGTIQLGGAYTGTTTTTFGGVRGSKESTTAGETGGQLEFFTRPNGGAMTRRAYISSTGNATFAGSIAIGNTVNTVSPTSPNRTITMVIGGTTYYIHAKTTND